ncbi:GldG family protein [bacterium]|nr:GldG family protein [bacterium]
MRQKIRKYGYASPVILLAGLGMYYVNGLWDSLSIGLSVLGAAGLVLWLAVGMDEVRQMFRARTFRSGTSTLLVISVAASVLVVVNLLGYRHFVWKDITLAKKYELSPLTLNVIKQIEEAKKEIHLTAFFWQHVDYNLSTEQNQQMVRDNARRESKLRDLLAVYSSVCPFIHFRFIDPNRELVLSQQYNIQRYRDNVVAVESGASQEMVTNMGNEEAVTNALIRALSADRRKIYFLQGHQERAIDDGGNSGFMLAGQAVADQSYMVEPLNVLEAGGVPADCRVLVIAGPHKPLLPDEIRLIDDYLENNGRVLVALDPEYEAGLDEWLLSWGIRVDKDIVVDNSAAGVRQGAGPTEPLIYSYDKEHPITAPLQKAFTTLPTVRSVRVMSDHDPEITLTVLASTSDNSWGETDLTPMAIKTPTFDPSDLSGPVPVAVAMHKKLEETEPGVREVKTGAIDHTPTQQELRKIKLDLSQRRAEMVVFGDSEFASNEYLRYGGNWDLFMNSINWLVGDERLISIAAKDPEDQTIYINQRQAKRMALAVQYGLPLLVLLFGVWVWVMRLRT